MHKILQTLLMAWLLVPAAAAAVEGSDGYLISLQIDHGTVQMDQATWLPWFVAPAAFPGQHGWQVVILDASGIELWSNAIPPAGRLAQGMPLGQAVLMSFRVPAPEAAATLLVRDAAGQVQFRQPMDPAFVTAAREARARFEQHFGTSDEAAPSATGTATAQADTGSTAEIEAYLTRQRAAAERRRHEHSVRPNECEIAGGRYIPELAATGRACVVPGNRPAPGDRMAGGTESARDPAGAGEAGRSANVQVQGTVRASAAGPGLPATLVYAMDASNNFITGAYSASNGAYALPVPANSRNLLESGRDSEIWPLPVVVDTGTGNVNRDLVVPARHNVTLIGKAPNGSNMRDGRISIWQEGAFVISARLSGTGEGHLTLPAGQYTAGLHVGERGYDGNDWDGVYLLAEPVASQSFQVTGATNVTLQANPATLAEMHITSNTEPFLYGVRPRLELLSGGQVVVASRLMSPVDSSSGYTASLFVSSGHTYQLRFDVPGAPASTSAPFIAQNGGTVQVTLPSASSWTRWTGVLRDDHGIALADGRMWVFDKMQDMDLLTTSAGDGSFNLPLCAHCSYRFEAPLAGNSIAKVVRLPELGGSLHRDVSLEALAFEPQAAVPGQLQRLYGPAAGDAYEILFLGDGYTAGNETWTDSNGSGMWDGVLWQDLNGDGVWDFSEPFGIYGDAVWPVYGEDPALGNEPFSDSNGDGALNIGEAQVFFGNAKDYMRALLGHDYWRQRRGSFRAWTYLQYSQHAGTSVEDGGGNPIVTRNTLYGATMETTRSLLSINYTLASQVANQVLPSYDTLVVIINQPVPMGRANSFILANGGLLAGSPNDDVPAHEFGHKVGGLGDEYDEFDSVYVGPSPGSPHQARGLDMPLVPWRDWLPVGFPYGVPTSPNLPGNGLFEGGSYSASGVYRSTWNSTMRYNAPLFSAYQEFLMNSYFRSDYIFADEFDLF